MQIMYELNEEKNSKWKHKMLTLSVTFMVTEYAPEEGFTLK